MGNSDPNRWRADQPLTLQVAREMSLMSEFVDRLDQDDSLREQFIREPIPVLVQVGILPQEGETPVSITRANRVFLSIVTNRELMRWIRENAPSIALPPEIVSIFTRWAVEKGELDFPSEYGDRFVKWFTDNEDYTKRLVSRLLQDEVSRPRKIGHKTAVA